MRRAPSSSSPTSTTPRCSDSSPISARRRWRPDAIYDAAADIYAPCALGATLNDQTIPRLKVEIVCGGANNQLAEPRHAAAVEKRGIFYAPDYVANGGGVINICREIEGWSEERALEKAAGIYDTVQRVVEVAQREKVTTAEAADRLAEERLTPCGRCGRFADGRRLQARAVVPLPLPTASHTLVHGRTHSDRLGPCRVRAQARTDQRTPR